MPTHPRWRTIALLIFGFLVTSCRLIEPTAPVSAPPLPSSTIRAALGPVNKLPEPLYFLGQDQQIWRLAQHGRSTTQLTTESSPIISFDFSPIHERFVYVTDNQLIEFDSKANTRTVKVKGETLPPTNADDRYTVEQSATLVLGTPRYSPAGTQIAYTLAGVNLVSSGNAGMSTPSQLLRNVLFLQAESAPLAAVVDLTTHVEEVRLYSEEINWSPDGEKILLGYSGWEWYGFEIYDLATASSVALPIGMAGNWQWTTNSANGIIANGGYGGVFETGLFLVDAQNAITHKLDLTPLGVTLEENPFTPLARAAFVAPSGIVSFFMATKFLRQDNNHHILYALAEIDLATHLVSWGQDEEKRQTIELGEVLWAADGRGVVNSLAPNPLQWLASDGSTVVDLGVIGSQMHWGSISAATTPVPTLPKGL